MADSAVEVLETIHRLQDAGREVRAVMVVRPDGAARLAEGIRWLQSTICGSSTWRWMYWPSWTPQTSGGWKKPWSKLPILWMAGLPRPEYQLV